MPDVPDTLTADPDPSLNEATAQFADWIRLHALPLWSTEGLADDGAFYEAINAAGRAVVRSRRARVQTRQVYVYAQAGLLGWQGPWREIVTAGLACLRRDFMRPDGLCRTLVDPSGAPLDDTVWVYDQAFALLALATARRAGIDDSDLEPWAEAIRAGLTARRSPLGGVPESGDQPYQANAHMHLLEACLAWEAAGGDPEWAALADSIVELALNRFIDAEGGFLREFFTADWRPAPGADGDLVEPGHQFEWVWLLTLYGRLRGDAPLAAPALGAADRLYASGLKGVSAAPAFAMNALNTDGSVRDAGSRLWPQTEWLKAALIRAEKAPGDARPDFLSDARSALLALSSYLLPFGGWRDRRLTGEDAPDDAPGPASSFYHIMAAFQQTARSGQECEDIAAVDLG